MRHWATLLRGRFVGCLRRERGLDDAAKGLTFGVGDDNGAGLGVDCFHLREGDGSHSQRGCGGGARDGADHFAGCVGGAFEGEGAGGIGKSRVGQGIRLLVGSDDALELDGDERLFALATRVHSGDDFLAQVAAFGEADAIVQDASLGGQAFGAEVHVVQRRAGFDAGHVVGVPAYELEADAGGGVVALQQGDGAAGLVVVARVVASGDELLHHGVGAISGNKELVAGDASGVISQHDDWCRRDGERGRGIGGERERRASAECKQVGGSGAVQGEAVGGLRDVGDGAIFGDDEGIEALARAVSGKHIDVEQRFVLELQHAHVGVDATLAVEPEAAAARVGSQSLHFLRNHAIEEVEPLGTREAENASRGLVEQGGVLAERAVFEFNGTQGCNDIARGRHVGGAVVHENAAGIAEEREERGGEGHEGG